VNGTFAQKITFMLVPVYDPAQPANSAEFDPSSPQSINQRFAKPVRYDVKIIAAEARH